MYITVITRPTEQVGGQACPGDPGLWPGDPGLWIKIILDTPDDPGYDK
ncbi:MAG: hypothetical protein JRF25_08610 [Deltaproteobacteria bacterium]|nr:hypothetical protein [Deltaproteobacteria bacterium]